MVRRALRHDDEAGKILPVAGIQEHLGAESGPFVVVAAFAGRMQIEDKGIAFEIRRLLRSKKTVKEGVAVRTAKSCTGGK